MGHLAHPLKIRGHHLLCMLGFRGLGYSKDFVKAMGLVVETFRAESELPVMLVTECDVICASCPHNRENRCVKKADSYRKIQTKDARILKKLGFNAGTETTVGEVLDRITENISTGDLKEMCQKCEWFGLGYCVEGLSKLAED